MQKQRNDSTECRSVTNLTQVAVLLYCWVLIMYRYLCIHYTHAHLANIPNFLFHHFWKDSVFFLNLLNYDNIPLIIKWNNSKLNLNLIAVTRNIIIRRWRTTHISLARLTLLCHKNACHAHIIFILNFIILLSFRIRTIEHRTWVRHQTPRVNTSYIIL